MKNNSVKNTFNKPDGEFLLAIEYRRHGYFVIEAIELNLPRKKNRNEL